MYSEWFNTRVTLAAEIPIAPETKQQISAISNFLAQQGYRNISAADSGVHAMRGRKIWNLINLGDPRRNYHSTQASIRHDTLDVKTCIDSWFGLGTKHDKAVFAAEIEMLRRLLHTGELSPAPLLEAQARRRKSDLTKLLLLVGVGVLIGIGAVTAVILAKGLR
jgi:hypothetical protein